MNRDCADNRIRLSVHLDGELTPDEATACARHLADCERCAAHLSNLAAARELLRSLPAPEPPDELLPSILAAAEREINSEREATELLRSMPQPVPPRDLLPAIVAAAQAEVQRGQRSRILWSRWRVAVGVTAAAAAALLAVTLATRPGHVRQPAPVVALNPDQAAPVTAEASAPAPVSRTSAAEVKIALAPPADPTPRFHRVPRVSAAQAAGPAATPQASPVAPASGADTTASGPVVAAAIDEPPAHTPMATGPIGPSDTSSPLAIAPVPRNSMAETTVAEGSATVSPEVQAELASGIVARVIVDNLITDRLLERAPTVLAVITDVPSSELGPVMAQDDYDDEFGPVYIESMRRALSAIEDGTP